MTGIPSAPVEKADEAAIDKLKNKGVIVLPVSQSSNYLEANFVIATSLGDSAINLLLPLKKQLVSVKLSSMQINDSALSVLGQCRNISRLELDHTNITDKGLDFLLPLEQLQSLNLVGTKITAGGLMKLKGLKKLQSIYLYQSNVSKQDWAQLKKTFPTAQLDSGGYTVPLLTTDTQIVKPPKVK
jgi:hypothetical protein